MTTNGNGHNGAAATRGTQAKNGLALNNRQFMALTSLLSERHLLASQLGQTFGGDRDMYDALGYKKTGLTPEYFLFRYLRGNIAKKIVNFPASETWKKPPVIIDADGSRSDEDSPASPFIQGVKALITGRRLWHYLERVDRVTGIGRYGLLLLGLKDGLELDKELASGRSVGPEGLLYFSVFGEMSVMNDLDSALVTDSQDPRYGLPTTYTLRMGQNLGSKVIHWSRVIHVVEEPLEDEIYGAPRLEVVDTLLDDLLKTVGGSAEANWFNAHPGYHFDIRDDANLGTDDEAAYSDEIEEFIHNLSRIVRTKNIDSKMFSPTLVDPTGAFKAIISLISGATDIPQRILTGSERGELASSQDAANWAGAIASRQVSFAEPVILRPVIDRLRLAGVLPEPAGPYKVDWPPIFELDETQRAGLAKTTAEALEKVAGAGKVAGAVDLPKFTEHYIPKLKDAVKQPEPPVVVAPPTMGQPGEPQADKLDSPAGSGASQGQGVEV